MNFIVSVSQDSDKSFNFSEWISKISETFLGKCLLIVGLILLVFLINFLLLIILEFISEKILKLPIDTFVLINTAISLAVSGYIIFTKIIDTSNIDIPDFLANPKLFLIAVAVWVCLKLLCLVINRYGINEKWDTVSAVIDVICSILSFAIVILFFSYLFKK